ncbi:MAG: hypothetical protein EXR80_10030 [Methylococcales bacterium]|nr:hypothetical protein [Methylococcales bacterium]
MRTQAKEKYTTEFKENAVKRANESSNVAEIARELGIKADTLTDWVLYPLSQLKLCVWMNICTMSCSG